MQGKAGKIKSPIKVGNHAKFANKGRRKGSAFWIASSGFRIGNASKNAFQTVHKAQPKPLAAQRFRVNLVKEVKKERDEIRKDTKKCKKEKPQVPLSGSLPLSGTQELTGGPLRGKMAAEGKNRADTLTAERHYFWAWA
ncbi:hypothetical protein LR48_Vigan10g167600 [Vigna angularis]|uniref:Uncharacterized protein n=1 Tax=Phaseolus angularis TaxID=3914 RepID=A0A0L9VM12_PHAAN|nr:hypothetical protein LR48_Vigan10g167600 [Vigna angularis]